MKVLKKIWWRLLFASYALVYLPWFFFLESKITMDYPGIHIINGPLDDLIPFCEIFIIPYFLWFIYIFAACVFMVLKSDNQEFIRFALSLIIGMSLCMFICMIYPNGLILRPDYIPDNIFGRMVAGLYTTDTSTNVFPSIHVYNSIAVHIALSKCKVLSNHKAITGSSLILCILICMSTVFLKQHSLYDVAGGIILMGILYYVIYVLPEKHTQRLAHRHQQMLSADE